MQVSMDRVIANKIGSATRCFTADLGSEDARQAGDCDSGYSCAYTSNLAWKSSTQPLPPILEPRQLFERLFGDGVAMTRKCVSVNVNTAEASSTSFLKTRGLCKGAIRSHRQP